MVAATQQNCSGEHRAANSYPPFLQVKIFSLSRHGYAFAARVGHSYAAANRSLNGLCAATQTCRNRFFKGRHSPLFEIARLLVRLDHVADHSVNQNALAVKCGNALAVCAQSDSAVAKIANHA
jgi:hypothetical protein